MASYVNKEDLAKWIRDKQSLQIIDVRDDDYEGGHIKGSVNVPSSQFATSLPNLIGENKGKEKVIFHCTLSQVRGPKAARIYLEGMELLGEGKAPHDKHGTQLGQNPVKQQVYVLKGGFQEWQLAYGSNAQLTEEWNKEYWEDFLG